MRDLRRRLTAIAIAPVLATLGCFGSGPATTAGADATTLLLMPQFGQHNCGNGWQYIGDVAVGTLDGSNEFGVTVPLPWEGPDCDDQGGVGNQANLTTVLFGDPSGTPLGLSGQVGSGAGQIMSGQPNGLRHPHVAIADGRALVWAYDDSSTGMFIATDTVGGTAQSPSSIGLGALMGTPDVAGLVTDGSASWVAIEVTQSALPDPGNPEFPCCGPFTPTSSGELWRVDYDDTGAVIAITEITGTPIWPLYTTDALAIDTDSVFFVRSETAPQIATLGQMAKTGSGDADLQAIATIDTSIGADATVVGLAADDAHVAFAASVDLTQPSSHPLCAIWSFALPATAGGALPTPLFTTNDFSCASLAIDGTSAYFAIISVDSDGDVHGDGIGAVDLATGELTSVALGMVGAYAGPRRVYVHGDTLYAIDPQAIGAIPIAALAGHHDF